MDYYENRKNYKKGVIKGALIGAGSVLIICVLVLCILFSNYYEKYKKMNPIVTESSSTYKKVDELISYINRYFLYDYDKDAMDNSIYKAVLDSLGDPYSVYYTADEYTELMSSTDGTYYGIGVVVTINQETGDITVVRPYAGSPGEEAGIETGDIITAVDGKSVVGMDLSLAVDLIKGEEGTYVKLTIERDSKTFDVDVERRKIDIETVAYELLDNNIGYIQISAFDGVTKDQFADALNDLIDKGMEGLIVDLRDNGGGRLDIVTDMLDTLLPEGIIVYTMDKNGNREDFKSDKNSVLDVPCVVLVNGNTASASEIFSGAMQDYGLAEIIGTQTFGKGIVQSVIPLGDGSAIKLTVEDYYTPNGNNIHGVGITPDEVVELDVDKYKEDGSDNQLQAGINYILKMNGK